MSLIADIFITHKPGRMILLEKCLEALAKNTVRDQYRLHLVVDGHWSSLPELDVEPDHILLHAENMGLGPSINQALSHIQILNEWYDHPLCREPEKMAPFVCYIQDDVLVSKDWLPKMAKFFMMYEKQYNLGFASGIECVEHPTQKDLGNGMLLKPWIRAANVFGRREYWMSMYPISRFDPETRQVRAKPNDGMGSGVDWWFVRNHNNSVCKTGRTNLVFPGMMVHAGYAQSTWLKRELPESEDDKKKVRDLR